MGAVNSGTNAFPLGAERRLEAFATLVGAAVTGAAARAELAAQALTDPLTGLANRRCFNLRLEQELQIAATRRGPLALLLFDVDRFKVVNDTHGHDVGDQVLREIARRLQRDRRVGDLVARVGGEEFALLLPGASLTAAVPLAERACEAVGAAPIGVAGRCTVSCGVVAWAEGDTTRTLMRRADDQLYRAKEGGRDRVAIDGVPGTLPGDPAAVSPPALPRS